jgi:hypothetical protein
MDSVSDDGKVVGGGDGGSTRLRCDRFVPPNGVGGGGGGGGSAARPRDCFTRGIFRPVDKCGETRVSRTARGEGLRKFFPTRSVSTKTRDPELVRNTHTHSHTHTRPAIRSRRSR